MDRLTEELRSSLREEASGISALGDMGQAIEHVDLVRRRWGGGISLGVLLLAVGTVLAIGRPAGVEPAAPTPPPATAPVEPSRLLPPLCADPADAAGRAPDGQAGPCPVELPVGANHGFVTGAHLVPGSPDADVDDMVRAVTLDIPGSGWTAGELGFSIEVVSPGGGNGVTVFAYPYLRQFPELGPVSGSVLLARLRDVADVEVLASGTMARSGYPFTWMDLRVADGAAPSSFCRLQAPCLELLGNGLVHGAAVELRPGRVSRVVVQDGAGRVPVAFWIHDISGPDAAAAIQVADSITLGQEPIHMPMVIPGGFGTVADRCAAGTLALTACRNGSTAAESTATQSRSTAASSTAATATR